MSFKKVAPGNDVPHDIHVIIEIPAAGDPVKYEVDKISGEFFVDRFMGTAMHYPTNYGYVPHSLAEDGDPVDVLVIAPAPLLTGCVVRCRPIGVLRMTDEAGSDAKVLAVPVAELTSAYDKVLSYEDIPEANLAKITHFFQHYKDLEKGKWVKIEGWFGPDEAKKEILNGVQRFNAAEVKPKF